jgi:hypothetical protein
MSISIDYGRDGTGETTTGLTVPLFDYSTVFNKKTDAAGECALTNTSSPMDRPEILRYKYQEIADVYKNSGVDPGYRAPSAKGRQILIQLNDIWKLVDSGDTSFRVDLPVQVHMVMRVPESEYITRDVLMAWFYRLAGATLDAAATGKLDVLMKGALVPADM